MNTNKPREFKLVLDYISTSELHLPVYRFRLLHRTGIKSPYFLSGETIMVKEDLPRPQTDTEVEQRIEEAALTESGFNHGMSCCIPQYSGYIGYVKGAHFALSLRREIDRAEMLAEKNDKILEVENWWEETVGDVERLQSKLASRDAMIEKLGNGLKEVRKFIAKHGDESWAWIDQTLEELARWEKPNENSLD